MPCIMPYVVLTILKTITAILFGLGVGLWTSSVILGLGAGAVVYGIITAVQRWEDRRYPKVGEFFK